MTLIDAALGKPSKRGDRKNYSILYQTLFLLVFRFLPLSLIVCTNSIPFKMAELEKEYPLIYKKLERIGCRKSSAANPIK